MEPFYVYAKPAQARHFVMKKLFPNRPSGHDAEFKIAFHRAGGKQWGGDVLHYEILELNNFTKNRVMTVSPPEDVVFAPVCFLPSGSQIMPPAEVWYFDGHVVEPATIELYIRLGLLQTALLDLMADLFISSENVPPKKWNSAQFCGPLQAARFIVPRLPDDAAFDRLRELIDFIEQYLPDRDIPYSDFVWRAVAIWGAALELTRYWRPYGGLPAS